MPSSISLFSNASIFSEFGYDVHDPNTGDVKSHSEKRDGHTVHGSYTVLDPDG